MGEVWKASDTRLDRLVAVKLAKADFSERFEREARAVAALNHANICTLYDIGPNYLVMELVEGAPLKGPLPLAKAIEYAGQILDALDAAHSKGITHRDLKPANILVTRQGIKLLDFGLAKQAAPLRESDATVTAALTGEGQIVGTLQYMAPEQLQGKEVDGRSDLFSFGCVLYEMLTGKRAFEGENAASVIAAILEREPAPLGVAPPLDRIIRRSLAKDPDQRFQTARDLKAAMLWAMEQPSTASGTATAFSSAPTPLRRSWLAMAILTLAGATAGAWGVWHFRQPATATDSYHLQLDPPEGSRFVFGNLAGGVALSPDGRTATYVASGGGKTGLWIRPLDGAAPRLVPGTENAAYPFWSPDGQSIGFFAGPKLLRVELAGGAPTEICDVTGARGGAWSSDGQIVYGVLSAGLFRVPASGGKPTPLTTPDASRGEVFHRWPQVLPGGRFLYSIQSEKPEHSGVFVASFANPKERIRLLNTDTNALYAQGSDGRSYLLWLRGGSLTAQQLNLSTLQFEGESRTIAETVARVGILGLMNAAVSASGLLVFSPSNTLSQFTWLDRTGKPLGTVGEPGEFTTFRISPDGHRVAASMDRAASTDLWMLDVVRGVSSRFTSSSVFGVYPIWSPDGRTILFSSGTPRNLVRKDSDGAGSEQPLYASQGNKYAFDWSRDGRFVLFGESTATTPRQFRALEITPPGSARPIPAAQRYKVSAANEWWGRFSPEPSPHWVAYQSDDTGRWEVFVNSFPEPRGAVRISIGGGQYPQWGATANELFYVSPDNKLMSVSLRPGMGTAEPSAPRELFQLPIVESGFSPYDTTPDGQRFLVRANNGQAAQPLSVIVNWPALLKKGAPQ